MAHELKDEEMDEGSDVYSDSSDGDEESNIPIIVLLTTGLWTIIFALFAFGFDQDPDQCYADNQKDLFPYRIPFIDDEQTQDGAGDDSNS